MSDIDKRLDEILDPPAYGFSGKFLCYECMFDFKEAKQAIKQLMVDEFEKLLSEISKNFRPELIDMAHKEYHPEIAPGFTLGFNLAKQLITDRLKRLEEFRK